MIIFRPNILFLNLTLADVLCTIFSIAGNISENLSVKSLSTKVLDGKKVPYTIHTRLEAYFQLNEFSTKTGNGTLELGTVGVPESVQPNQISPIF